jgi:hypothetical protein
MPKTPSPISQAVMAALLLTVLLPDLNEAREIRVCATEAAPTMHATHDQSDTTRGPHLHYVMPRAPVDYRIEVPTMHMKMTPGRITVRVERAVPEQLDLFA